MSDLGGKQTLGDQADAACRAGPENRDGCGFHVHRAQLNIGKRGFHDPSFPRACY